MKAEISFHINIEKNIKNPVMLLRCTANNPGKLRLKIKNQETQNKPYNKIIELNHSTEIILQHINLDNLKSGKYLITLTSLENSNINLDGFAIGSKEDIKKINFKKIN